MPPHRGQNPYTPEASTSNTRVVSAKNRSKHRRSEEKVPGVQKIKAALRQTRRLLSKDQLAADVKVETERRLKALEVDLQAAQITKKERTLAVRYHKVKFFERQKVTRKIKQVQNRLALEQSKSEKKKLALELQELRVDLNYIFYYPKLRKYISLFPPDVRKGDDVTQSEAQKTRAEREDIRNWIRDGMRRGEFSSEPELTLGSHRENQGSKPGPRSDGGIALETRPFKRKGSADKVEEDEFFAVDETDAEGD